MDTLEKQHTVFPSRFSINESVRLEFFDAGSLKNCKIIKVYFTESKVLYDIEVSLTFPPNSTVPGDKEPFNYKTRIYNIDSIFVKDL